jgi:hypothetical protein
MGAITRRIDVRIGTLLKEPIVRSIITFHRYTGPQQRDVVEEVYQDTLRYQAAA